MNAFPIRGRVLATALAIAALVAVPAAAAAAPAPDRGDHGAQAQCRYVTARYPGWDPIRLKRMTVQPPTLFAVGSAGQVGWRMIVQRRYDNTSWKRIFASVTQKRTATPTEAAPFGPLSALINSPIFLQDGTGGWLTGHFRVVLGFFWYAPDGSVTRAERHLVANYDVMRDGAYLWTDKGHCYHSWLFDD